MSSLIHGVGEFYGFRTGIRIPGGPGPLVVIVKCTVSTGKELQQAELFNEINSVSLEFKADQQSRSRLLKSGPASQGIF